MMSTLAQRLQQQLTIKVKIFCTSYPKKDFSLLDIVHPEASKGAGVAAAAAELAIEQDEIMAIGDNHNDLEMLEYAGTSVVMENAEPALLQNKRFHLTTSNDADGVAVAIEKFILDEPSSQTRTGT
jgi:hydroxymethylpyrimidine pyrophosphatase-like HAD family hydrolase